MTTLHDERGTRPSLRDEQVETIAEPPIHAVIAAPARMGKSTSIDGHFPNLLERSGAVYILDPRGVYQKGTR